MSASPQFIQLDMWKPASELYHEMRHRDSIHYGTEGQMWKAKKEENDAMTAGKPFTDSEGTMGVDIEDVRKNGIRTPVDVHHDPAGLVLGNGHHRVSAAIDIHPDYMVPVNHILPL
jgi:hypothetical protein